MENALAKKLRFKSGNRILLAKAPANFNLLFHPDTPLFKFDTHANGFYDVLLLFVQNSADLKQELPEVISHMRPDSIFWICYPKKSSGIVSDLSMMAPWDELKKYGLDGVAAAAIDKTWTALRFRPHMQVKKTDGSKSQIAQTELSQYINFEKRTVSLPHLVQEALRPYPAALIFFEKLSFTNQKEYITWFLSAKQEKTRQMRLHKIVDKLVLEQKNPSEK